MVEPTTAVTQRLLPQSSVCVWRERCEKHGMSPLDSTVCSRYEYGKMTHTVQYSILRTLLQDFGSIEDNVHHYWGGACALL